MKHHAIAALATGALMLASPVASAPVLPDFAAATFVPGAPIDNLYFPILDDRTRVYVGQTADGELNGERFKQTRIGAGPTLLGVQTTARRDLAFEDDLIVEDTIDYFAQDSAGNVWYFGEDVTNFEYDDEGNLIGTNDDGSWRAGVNDALPGFAMPADLTLGFSYFQEFAPNDDAVDEAVTGAILDDVVIGIGAFDDVLKVLETTSLEPGVREAKFYAPGVGLIMEWEGLDEDFENPEAISELTEAVPEPGMLSLFGAGLIGVGMLRRRRRRSC